MNRSGFAAFAKTCRLSNAGCELDGAGVSSIPPPDNGSGYLGGLVIRRVDSEGQLVRARLRSPSKNYGLRLLEP